MLDLLSSQVEFNVELNVKFLELVPYFVTHAADIAVFAIVKQTVVEYEQHFIQKLLSRVVVIRVEPLLDGTEVDRVLYNIMVV